MNNSEFEKLVLEKLDSIHERLGSIDSRFAEATALSESILVDNEGILAGLDFGAIKDALSGFVQRGTPNDAGLIPDTDGEQLQELASVLSGFREKLSTVMTSLADVGEESVPAKTMG